MKTIEEIVDQYYERFKGLPNGRIIVRENKREDAYAVAAFSILYGYEDNPYGIEMNSITPEELGTYIVAPPDSGIDIIFEHQDADECFYDFIQVKSSKLEPVEIAQAFSYMEDTVKKYLRNPKNVSSHNLKEVLAQKEFGDVFKKNITYIVIHDGDLNAFRGQKANQKIITLNELEILKDNSRSPMLTVKEEVIKSDEFHNMTEYSRSADNYALLCNLSGYDLAVLSNKYMNTTLGRNILFGQNLRDTLSKSKTSRGMAQTIDNEPEKFWYYNNGITIIAEEVDTARRDVYSTDVDSYILRNFSIINGAQTTSALEEYYKEARINHDNSKLEQLKKVYVLTRILQVKDPQLGAKIAIYNNTQNPITTRDMVSNNPEQIELYTWLCGGESPHIFVEIRRGSKKPSNIRFLKHQVTDNLELAQLAFAGFERNPFLAKDKKSRIFDVDHNHKEKLVNEYYHQIFHYSVDDHSEGVLFNRTKEEINELLFVRYLYKEAKKYLVKIYKDYIYENQERIETLTDPNRIDACRNEIAQYQQMTSACKICMFYCLALYYSYKNKFIGEDEHKRFKYEEFYDTRNRDYHDTLVEEFASSFLSETIAILLELYSAEDSDSLSNWIRLSKNSKLFIEKIDNELRIKIQKKREYSAFVAKYKEEY